jgi:hypothetical protein
MSHVYVFNATPVDMRLTLNGRLVGDLHGTMHLHDHTPQTMVIARDESTKPGHFGPKNTLVVTPEAGPSQVYRFSIGPELPTGVELQLYLFFKDIVLVSPVVATSIQGRARAAGVQADEAEDAPSAAAC